MREIVFRLLPWAVLAVCLAFTMDAWRGALDAAERARNDYFDGLLRDTATAIFDRIDGYRDANLGAAGLFAASDDVNRDEWRQYQERLGLPRRHPGAQGLGYAEYVPPAGEGRAEAGSRADDASGAAVDPKLPLREQFVIRFTDPLRSDDSRVGFDAASVTELRRAMESARDTGRTRLSERVVFDLEGEPRVIFVLFTPVYAGGGVPDEPQRRHAEIQGWVYAPFDARLFVQGLLDTLLKESDPLIDLALYSSAEPDPAFLLYSDGISGTASDDEDLYAGSSRLELYGATWSLVVKGARPHAFYDRRREAWAVLSTGLVTSALLFGVVEGINRRRRQALALAAAMTDDLVARARELRRSNAELKIARDRAEMAASTLLEQHDSLARAERLAALGEMAASLAHELRNPIASMMTSLENLLRESQDAEVRARLELITQEMQRLSRLLSAYLAPARHEPEAVDEVDVVQMVDELCTLVRYRLPSRIRLEVHAQEPLRWMIPRDRVRQALLNLVLNALQAIESTGEEGGCIEVHAEVQADELVLRVLDDGPGFPEEMLRSPGQAFLSSRDGGTGLGLAMVRRVARDLGGRLELARRAPAGAEVRLALPGSPPTAARA